MTDPPKRRVSLSTKIFVGMGLGILTGLMFGEVCAKLDFIGKAFINLLQMTILPYIVVSLVTSIGGLTFEQAKRLAGRVGLLLAGLWLVCLVLVVVTAFAFPVRETAAFFSTSALATPPPINLIDLYIPTNPFNSLANQIIPAVVMFTILVGIALIGVPGKEPLLQQLTVLGKALTRVANGVARLTPIGVFALSASAAGTMTTEELERVQAYLIGYTAMALLVTFGIMPLIVSMVTPFRYRDIIRETKDALVTGFTTANLFVTLPLLNEGCRRLFEKHDVNQEEAMASVDVIMPTVFSFPKAGKVLVLLFVPFAAWYVGEPMAALEYISYSFVGLVTFFGSPTAALPFLLDGQHLPIDLFQLYIVTSVVVDRMSILASAMHMQILALLATAMTLGMVVVRVRRVVTTVVALLALTLAVVVGIRAYLEFAVSDEYTKDKVIAEMQLLEELVPSVVHDEAPEKVDPPEEGVSRIDQIRNRGILRVGYDPIGLPWTYRNADGELVGFNIDVAHRLAQDLEVTLEFIPAGSNDVEWGESMRAKTYDVLMAGVAATPDAFAAVRFTAPYIHVHAALIVPDHARKRFKSLDAVRKLKGLRLAAPQRGYLIRRAAELLPEAEIVPVDSAEAFFSGEEQAFDAFLWSAEGGSAWTLLYPRYTVVLLRPDGFALPMAYPVPEGEEFVDFLSQWIELKKDDGTIDEIAAHWLYGKTDADKQPRWSIIRDVLHWID